MNDIRQLIERFRQSPLIKETRYENISAFNFTRKAFNRAEWNDLTTRARGMFIDTERNWIVCRGYDKFFQVDERPETKKDHLRKALQFPVRAYVKENGFLGLISFDAATRGLRFATKARLDGQYVEMLKESFYRHCGNPGWVITTLKNLNATLLVEVIEPEKDPHIIQYLKPNLIVLDLIRNDLRFDQLQYEFLVSFANKVGLPVKKVHRTYTNWEELEHDINEWETESYRLCGEPVEGFVLEDSTGFMVKVKTGYYKLWKWRRSMIGKVMNGKYEKGADPFGDWMYDLNQINPFDGTEDIIQFRLVYEYFFGGM